MAKRISDKNTKAEILEAYKELQKEKNALESQQKKANAVAASAPASVPVAIAQLPVIKAELTQELTQELPQKEAKKPMNVLPVNQPKIQATVDSLLHLHLGFGGAINELSEKLTAEATKLQEIRETVTTEVGQLQTLHNLETVTEETLNNLMSQYEESAKTFEAEFAEQKETIEQEMSAEKQAWEKEQETHQRTIKERNENQKKTQQRDGELYQYNLQLQRQIDKDEYDRTQKGLAQALAEIRSNQEKEWQAKEEALALREKEYAEVKAKVDAFPQELENNIKNGKENGRNIGHYQAKVKADLWGKEVEGQKQVYELRIQGLEKTIQSQEARVQSLSKQLEAAQRQVQDLAVKAIEGASNASSFQAVKEIAMEQVKNLPKNK